MISRLLVANRGEIARRVFTTCRRLGIATVAVHSDADAGLPFVAEADQAVRLPGSAPADTYLRGDLVIEAARRAGADAIHPGYGFLSENADFARAVLDAGLAWLGPPPKAIEAMGSKIEAKRLMAHAGVPVLEAPDEPTEADLPLLVKASAGGGGRGMRVVRSLDDLATEVDKAAAEAASAFGDGTVFVEPYVERGRHVEVQVVAGADGGVLVLGDRDCSVQRRHQKVVEEAPAPGLPDEVRQAMHQAAADAATAIDYRGAGTVEFLYDPATDRFFFLEMNTRLQVEHPVTEAVFGVDLVELQVAVAEGQPLDVTVTPRDSPDGHAVEVRLYAEDPAAGWQPQSGRLVSFDVPDVVAEFAGPVGHGIRLDTGFVAGSEVGTHYDAMLAKVIAWAPTRDRALRQLAGALTRARVHGVTTNRDLLVEVLRHPAFVAGELGTDFLERHDLTALAPADDEAGLRLAATAAALALVEADAARRTVQRGIPTGWRNVVSQPHRKVLESGGRELTVEWHGGRDGYVVDGMTVLSVAPGLVRLAVDGVASTWQVAWTGGPNEADSARRTREVWVDGPVGSVRLREVPRFTDPTDAAASGSLLAPMPGSVVDVAVEVGAEVAAGQPVLVMEAMKMQHTVTAPTDGVVTEINVEPGSQVAAGDVLAVVSTEEEDA